VRYERDHRGFIINYLLRYRSITDSRQGSTEDRRLGGTGADGIYRSESHVVLIEIFQNGVLSLRCSSSSDHNLKLRTHYKINIA
ncbi:hypothetical protein AVEN_198304-1, partial [Araneus ventricosus]